MILNRIFYLDKLVSRIGNGRIKVITGIRRCGKSVLLFDIFKDYLLNHGVGAEQIVTMKLDVASNARYRNPLELIDYINSKTASPDTQYYVLIDEIQEVHNIPNPWLADKDDTIGFVDVVLELLERRNVDVYVTGSNSRMLSSDVITQFRDRGDEIHLYPFTYREFFDAYPGDKSFAWQDYITFGGLPHIIDLHTDSDKSRYLRDLIQHTYLTDVVERNNIKKDVAILDDMLNILASNVGSLTNPKKLEHTFASVKNTKITDSTISAYLDCFCDAYIISKASQYDVKGKKYIGSPMKYYFTDIGLRNAQLNFRQQEETHIMENVLYNELIARGYSVDVGIVEYNYKDEQGRSKRTKLEVDFVVNLSNQRYYIQSAFAIPDEEKRLQETNSLRRINDSYRKIVVVRSNIKPWTDDNGIYYIGIETFLLDTIYRL